MNYNLKFDIKKLNRAFVYSIQGKNEKVECVCIPVSEFFAGKIDKDGHVPLYSSFEVKERKEVGSFGDTHFVKQQLEKSSYSALTEEQKKSIPIIGSFAPSKYGNDTPKETEKPADNVKVDDTLPF
jgi:hypothetical protein